MHDYVALNKMEQSLQSLFSFRQPGSSNRREMSEKKPTEERENKWRHMEFSSPQSAGPAGVFCRTLFYLFSVKNSSTCIKVSLFSTRVSLLILKTLWSAKIHCMLLWQTL